MSVPSNQRAPSANTASDDLFAITPVISAPLSPTARIACLRLVRSEGIGPVTFRDLIAHTGTPEAALASLPELARRGGRTRPISICTASQAEAELEAANRIGATVIFSIEPTYPAALAAIDAPPPLIYVRGNANFITCPALAIVGSRQCSAAGHKLAGQFARALGEKSLVIISGLARGIDAAAHEAALATGTVAVIAGGLNHIYPPEHADLQRRIIEHGCLVTEMPPDFRPRSQDFPRRNRIISGLSRGVLIIEAAHRSGSLVTARLASEQGREVFAVPGHPLDPRAEGTNQLLKSGATFVTNANDILEALQPSLSADGDIFGIADGAERTRWDPGSISFPASIGAFDSDLAGQQSANSIEVSHDARKTTYDTVQSSTGPLNGASKTLLKTPPKTASPATISDLDRANVLSALGTAPTDIDSVARATGLSIQAVHIVLLELGLGGRVTRYPGGLVGRAAHDNNSET